MRKKVIFLDIDGTLTEPGCHEPPASAVEAIQKARADGHYVFLCSGRRSEERRVGKECASKCRSRWSPYH